MTYSFYKIAHAAEFLSKLITKHHVTKLFVVRGKSSFMISGGQELVRKILILCHIHKYEFSDFSPNPSIEDAYKGAKRLNEYKPDVIVAIGGGSVIDMAKLVRYFADQVLIPLVAIPTTAGTGAETTQFAVCYENGRKVSIDRADLKPEYSILVPELTMKNNSYLTACTGFDALAQSIESYWNINATSESVVYAEDAISYLSCGLPNLFKRSELPLNEYERREQILIGAHLAGKAINITRTTAPHALSYVLTSKYGYPHGHAVALTFPYFFEKNVRCSKDEYAGKDYWAYHAKMQRLVRMMGWNWSDDLYKKMKDYIVDIGLGYDQHRPFEPNVVVESINLERAKNNPAKLNIDIIKEAVASILK